MADASIKKKDFHIFTVFPDNFTCSSLLINNADQFIFFIRKLRLGYFLAARGCINSHLKKNVFFSILLPKIVFFLEIFRCSDFLTTNAN